MGTNRKVFNAEVFAIYPALRAFDKAQGSGHRYTIFADPQAAIQSISTDLPRPGQCWARAAIEVCSCLVA